MENLRRQDLFFVVKTTRLTPVVKWAGGKRQLLSDIMPFIPERYAAYCEPFLGGGAVLFALQPEAAIVNDINADLIQTYEVIRDQVEDLISALEAHVNEADHYYRVRRWDREHEFYVRLGRVERAARIIYLNKTCYNGLFRVNNAGEFNTPFGRYKNPDFVNATNLRKVSQYLQRAQITFRSGDYFALLSEIKSDDFVYLDPPYDPVSRTASFTGYVKGGFNQDEQLRLKEFCDRLDAENVKFLLSNSSTEFIRDLYQGYEVTTVKARRVVNSAAGKRGRVDEVLIRNYA